LYPAEHTGRVTDSSRPRPSVLNQVSQPMQDLLANIAVAAATVATLFFLVPQIVKLVRTGDSAGVSTTWPGLSARR